MSNTTRIRGVCPAAKRKAKRPTRATAAAIRYVRKKNAGCICSQEEEECKANMSIAQHFASKCGLDPRDERDYNIMLQLCDAYHEGWYAGFDEGYEYVKASIKTVIPKRVCHEYM